jgi:hypothetical protein
VLTLELSAGQALGRAAVFGMIMVLPMIVVASVAARPGLMRESPIGEARG